MTIKKDNPSLRLHIRQCLRESEPLNSLEFAINERNKKLTKKQAKEIGETVNQFVKYNRQVIEKIYEITVGIVK